MSKMIKKILVVDDDFLIRKWFVLLLKQSAGCEAEVLQAENGQQALELLREQPVDLVITDIKMPVMDGIGLIRQLRAQPESPQIVVLSSYDEYTYVRAALKDGVLDYLLKGELEQGSIDAMLDMAENVLRESKKEKNIGKARVEIQRRSHLLRDYIDRGIGNGREIAQTLSGKELEPPYIAVACFWMTEPWAFCRSFVKNMPINAAWQNIKMESPSFLPRIWISLRVFAPTPGAICCTRRGGLHCPVSSNIPCIAGQKCPRSLQRWQQRSYVYGSTGERLLRISANMRGKRRHISASR